MISYDDFGARDSIRTDINTNFFVEAGAGSGKTSVLVDRMVAMVEGGMDISKICAITFTKAAANEFYARFQRKLSESNSPLAKAALRDIDLCFMGTLDAFCNMVLSEHPAKARIPSDAQIIDDHQAELLYLREYSLLEQGEYGEELQNKCRKFKACTYDAPNAFVKLMRITAGNKNVTFKVGSIPEGLLDDAFADLKTRCIDILSYLASNRHLAFAGKAAKNAAAWETLSDSLSAISDSWDEDPQGVIKSLSALNDLRLCPEADIEVLGPGYEEVFVPHYTRDKLTWYEIDKEDGLIPILSKLITNYCAAVAADFAVSATGPVTEKLNAEGNLTFTDYLVGLRDLLKADAEDEGKLIKHIYDKHSYFLIDEFQDTNPIQAEIFFYLAAQNPQSDWRTCIPKPGSLFIVGDPKQSIYRFRSADVASFLRVRDIFDNLDNSVGQVLYLTRNFRSSDPMCEWFNRVFTDLLPEDTAIQSKFNEIPLGEKLPYTASLSGAYSYTISSSEETDYHIVAGLIKRIVTDQSITIQDRDKGNVACEPRNATYKDFMVITRSKSHMQAYMKAMTEYGIPFRIEGKTLFNDCPALSALSYLMFSVADPYNKKYQFAAKHLSGCSFNSDKTADYAKRSACMSPAALMNMLLEEERIFAKTGTRNAEYVYYALELLRAAESSGVVASHIDGAEYIRKLIADESGEERCIQLTQSSNCVHFANLHKVKGLEAPIVILADPNYRKQDPDIRVDYSTSPPVGWIFGDKRSSVRSKEFPVQEQAEKDVLESEDIRLLYVAATRAADVLIASNKLLKDGTPSSSNPWLLFLNYIDRDIVDEIGLASPDQASSSAILLDAEALYDKAASSDALSNRAAEVASYEIRKPSSITIKSRVSNEDDYEDKTAEELTVAKTKRNPALIGTMVHKLMEALVSSRNSVDTNLFISEIVDEYMTADDNAPDYYSNILKAVADTIQNGGYKQAGDAPSDILTELLNADETYCELPFSFRDGSQIWHGIMDVVYRKDCQWYILDYKTNQDASDLDEHYREQLDAYISAFKAMTGEDAIARTYHIAV